MIHKNLGKGNLKNTGTVTASSSLRLKCVLPHCNIPFPWPSGPRCEKAGHLVLKCWSKFKVPNIIHNYLSSGR